MFTYHPRLLRFSKRNIFFKARQSNSPESPIDCTKLNVNDFLDSPIGQVLDQELLGPNFLEKIFFANNWQSKDRTKFTEILKSLSQEERNDSAQVSKVFFTCLTNH